MATAIPGDVGSSGSSIEHSYIAMSVFLFLDVVFHLSPLKKNKNKEKNFLSFTLFRNKISQVLKILQVSKISS